MAATQVKTLRFGSVQQRTILQLLLCHGLIFFVAILSGAHALAILGACLLSFLLLLNIPYNLQLLEVSLDRLVRGLHVEPISLHLRWPLTGLFALVNALSSQAGRQVQMEQRTIEYHDQLLQQVSKTAAQEERNRLARDLHDTIKQQLFSIVVSAAAIKARWEHNAASVRTVIDDIERTAQEAQVEMQALLQQLRPSALENVGLIESLRMQCQALSYRTEAEVTAELGELPPDELLPLGTQEMLFRIVQEGFANIARHARATHIWLSLQWQKDALLVEIGDDGQGFDLAQENELPTTYGGMGLSNVRERVRSLGGTVAIWSLRDKGTTLHMCIPLVKAQLRAQEQERTNAELALAGRQAQRILRAGRWAAELAAAFILLYIPASIATWPVLLCLLVALACWLWAQQHRFQLTLESGRDQALNFALRAESYGLLSGILLLGMLSATYFEPFMWTGRAQGSPLLYWMLSFYSVFMIAIIVTFVRSYSNTGRCYKALSREALQEEFRRQFQQVVIDWMAWTILLALTIFLLNFFPSVLTGVPMQAMGFILLFAWFLILLLKSIRIARWQNALHRLAEPANQGQKRSSV